MKTLTNLFNSGFFTLGWVVLILLCYFSFKEERESIRATMKENLYETVSIDYQERLNKVLVHYRPLGRKVKGFEIKQEGEMETISFEDSTNESLAARLVNQYIMAEVIPVNPDEFNEIFKKEWEKTGISAIKTGIIYCHNKKKVFSGNDSISFQSALVTPVQVIDAKKTVGVQAWAMIHWAEIVRHITPKVLWSIFAYFIILLGMSLSFLIKTQKKIAPINQDSLQLGKMILKLESKKLYIDGRPCPIAPTDFHLLVLFIKAPNYFLTKEDIKNAFWPTEDKPDNKIHTHISTLKSSLKDFPEYQIRTEPYKGYRLVVSSNE